MHEIHKAPAHQKMKLDILFLLLFRSALRKSLLQGGPPKRGSAALAHAPSLGRQSSVRFETSPIPPEKWGLCLFSLVMLSLAGTSALKHNGLGCVSRLQSVDVSSQNDELRTQPHASCPLQEQGRAVRGR